MRGALMIHFALEVASFLFLLVCGLFLIVFGSLFIIALLVRFRTRI
jgi:hypothetical protein